MVLWDEVFAAVAQDFPEIATESLLVDRAVMEFVRRPESFDVVVASNLFGDILTDLAAIIVGSMGLAASANIDPTRPASEHVRTGARIRTGHRRQGDRQSACRHPLRRYDAGTPPTRDRRNRR